MGLGGTAKKLQKVTQAAEDLYAKMNEVIGHLKELRREVQHTSEQVDRMERDMIEQRVVLEAIAAEHDIDLEDRLADVEYPSDLEPEDSDEDGEDGEDGDGEANDEADSADDSSAETDDAET